MTEMKRQLSSRRGSVSAHDPYGVNAECETERNTSARITIVRVPSDVQLPEHKSQRPDHTRRSSMGAAAMSSPNREGGNRLSFAFSSFHPPSQSPTGSSPPPRSASPDTSGIGRPLVRKGSGASNMERPSFSRHSTITKNLTPQEIYDIAATATRPPPKSQPGTPSIGHPSPSLSPNKLPNSASSNGFTVVPESYFLPFINRTEEVTLLLSRPPNSRILALLAQTFPQSADSKIDFSSEFKNDPTTWNYDTLHAWLCTVQRSDVADAVWVSTAKRCIASKSELIWERLKTALGVPPDLDSDDELEWDHGTSDPIQDDNSEGGEEAFFEPIFPGDAPIPSPLSPGIGAESEDTTFGFGGRDGGMENIGEQEEESETKAETTEDPSKSKPSPPDDLPIHGIRITTSATAVNPPLSRGASLGRNSSTGSGNSNVPVGRRDSVGKREASRQVRDPGNPLFLGSFANLTVGPTLVSSNPRLRNTIPKSLSSGSRRFSHRSVRDRDGEDGHDYAVTIASSGSEASFTGR